MPKRESKFVDSYFSKPWIEPLLATFDPKRVVCPVKPGHMIAQVISVKEGCPNSLLESDLEIYGSTNIHDSYVRTGAVFTKKAIEEFEEYEEPLTGCEFEHLPNCIIILKKFHIIPSIVENIRDCDFVVCIEEFNLYTHEGPTCTFSSLPWARSTYSVVCNMHRLRSSIQGNTSEESGMEPLTNSDPPFSCDNLSQLLAEVKKDQSRLQSSQSGEGTQSSAACQSQSRPSSGPDMCVQGPDPQVTGPSSQSDDSGPGKSKERIDGRKEQDGGQGSSTGGEEECEVSLKWRHIHQLTSWVFEVRPPPRASSSSTGDAVKDEMEEVVKWVKRCLENLPDVTDQDEESSCEKDALPAEGTQESATVQSSAAHTSPSSRRNSRRGKRKSPLVKKPSVLRGKSSEVDRQEHEEQMMYERIKKQLPTTELVILSPDELKPLPPEFDLGDDSDDTPHFGDLNNNIQLQEWVGDDIQEQTQPSATNSGEHTSNSAIMQSNSSNLTDAASKELFSMQEYTSASGQSLQGALENGQNNSKSTTGIKNVDIFAERSSKKQLPLHEYALDSEEHLQSDLEDFECHQNTGKSVESDLEGIEYLPDSGQSKQSGQDGQEYPLDTGQSPQSGQEKEEYRPDNDQSKQRGQDDELAYPLDIQNSQKEMDEILDMYSQELSQNTGDRMVREIDTAVQSPLLQNPTVGRSESFGQTYIVHHHYTPDEMESPRDETARDDIHSSPSILDDETKVPSTSPPYPVATVSSPLMEKRCLMPSTSPTTLSDSSQSDFVLNMSGDSDFTILKCSIDDHLQKADGRGDHEELSDFGSDSDSDIFSPKSPQICVRTTPCSEKPKSFPEGQLNSPVLTGASSGDMCCILSAMEGKDGAEQRKKQREDTDSEANDVVRDGDVRVPDPGTGTSLATVAEFSRKRKQSVTVDDCDKGSSVEKRLRFADSEQSSQCLDESSKMDVVQLVQAGMVMTSTQKDGSDVAVQETIFIVSSDEDISPGESAPREVSGIPSAGSSGWMSKQDMIRKSRSGPGNETIEERESEDTQHSELSHSTNAENVAKQHSVELPIVILSSGSQDNKAIADSAPDDPGHFESMPICVGSTKKQPSKDSFPIIPSSGADTGDSCAVKSQEANGSVKECVRSSIGTTPSAGSSRSSDKAANYSVTPVLFSSEESAKSTSAGRNPLEQLQGQTDKTAAEVDPRPTGRTDRGGMFDVSQCSDNLDEEEPMSIGTPEDSPAFTQEGTQLPLSPLKESNNVKSPTEQFTRIRPISLSSSGRHFVRNVKAKAGPVETTLPSNCQTNYSTQAPGNDTHSKVHDGIFREGQNSEYDILKEGREKNESNPLGKNTIPAKNLCNNLKSGQQERELSSSEHQKKSKNSAKEPKSLPTQSVTSSKIYMGPMKMKQLTLRERRSTETRAAPSCSSKSKEVAKSKCCVDSVGKSSKKAKSDMKKNVNDTFIENTNTSTSDIRFTSLGKSPSRKGTTPKKRVVNQIDESHYESSVSCSSSDVSSASKSRPKAHTDNRNRSILRRKKKDRHGNGNARNSSSPVFPYPSQDQDENRQSSITESMLNGTYLPPSDDSGSTEGEDALLEWCARYLLESSKR